MLKYYHSRIKLERIEEETTIDIPSSSSSSPIPQSNFSIDYFNNNNNNNSNNNNIIINNGNINNRDTLEIDENVNHLNSDEEQYTPPIPSPSNNKNNNNNSTDIKQQSNEKTSSNNNLNLNGSYQLALGLFPLCPSLYNVFVRYEEINPSLNNILLLTNRIKVLSNLLNFKSTASRYELSVENLTYRLDLYNINSVQISEICSMCLEVSRLMSFVDPVFRNPIDNNQFAKIVTLTKNLLKSIKIKLLQLFSRNGCSLIKQPLSSRPSCSSLGLQFQQQHHQQPQYYHHNY